MAARLLLATLLVLGGWLWVRQEYAGACQCDAYSPLATRVQRADVILVGTHLGGKEAERWVQHPIEHAPRFRSSYNAHLVQVDRYLKGTGADRVVIASGGACPDAFGGTEATNETRLIFAGRANDGRLAGGLCWPSQNVSGLNDQQLDEILTPIGDLLPPQSEEPLPFEGDPLPDWAPLAGIVAAIAAGGGLFLLGRRVLR